VNALSSARNGRHGPEWRGTAVQGQVRSGAVWYGGQGEAGTGKIRPGLAWRPRDREGLSAPHFLFIQSRSVQTTSFLWLPSSKRSFTGELLDSTKAGVPFGTSYTRPSEVSRSYPNLSLAIKASLTALKLSSSIATRTEPVLLLNTTVVPGSLIAEAPGPEHAVAIIVLTSRTMKIVRGIIKRNQLYLGNISFAMPLTSVILRYSS
jgi:hypothetical protein